MNLVYESYSIYFYVLCNDMKGAKKVFWMKMDTIQRRTVFQRRKTCIHSIEASGKCREIAKEINKESEISKAEVEVHGMECVMAVKHG